VVLFALALMQDEDRLRRRNVESRLEVIEAREQSDRLLNKWGYARKVNRPHIQFAPFTLPAILMAEPCFSATFFG
jgi:hypothetical protein